MNREYNIKLDLQFKCSNSTMRFKQFDNNTSDFFIKISNGGKSFDIEKAIIVLATIKPSGKVASQFIEVENDAVYADLKPSMRDEIGVYTAQAMLILEDERVVTDTINYEVSESNIISAFVEDAGEQEEYSILTEMISKLSTIEISEEERIVNEAERILAEENRKIEEAKRVEAELVRVHEEADRAKYDATREGNENIRKLNEDLRKSNENIRLENEAKRVEEENKRILAEEERNANYSFMTEDEERRRLEANAHNEAESLRFQSEANRVNEEAKRRATEQARVSAENTRVSNENTRKSNEVTRQSNETDRVNAETQRQSRYNTFITNAENNANSFKNYTDSAKVEEQERKSSELDRKSNEDRRISNETARISSENTRKSNEVTRQNNENSRKNVFANKVNEVNSKISEIDKAKSDMTNTISDKVKDIDTRFNALTSSQQQSSEVIDARDGETSLKSRLDRDIEKAKQIYVDVEGNYITTDSSEGYLKNVEIFGNTIQDIEQKGDLADIRSVGDKVEGQELYEIDVVSCGKNLNKYGNISFGSMSYNDRLKAYPIKVNVGKSIYFSVGVDDSNNSAKLLYEDGSTACNGKNKYFVPTKSIVYFYGVASFEYEDIQLEEGTVATPYEPYKEDKLTILSPVQLERVGDVADRIICKDGVWGVEKNVTEKLDLLKATWIRHIENDNNLVCKTSTYSDVVFKEFSDCIVSNFIRNTPQAWNGQKIGISTFNDGMIYLCISKSLVPTINDLPTYLKSVGAYAICRNSQPQFIPLPHDQQVKLRTFAGQTNIHFETGIEGTIKAQVPKSLGASINTHTEQIENLSKELDRVKKLEESTVSTVVTESDFTTVEETSNGYFEDVKLEGKTLVNLCKKTSHTIIGEEPNNWDKHIMLTKPLVVGNKYTLIVNVKTYTLDKGYSIFGRTALGSGGEAQYSLLDNITKSGIYKNVFTARKDITMLSMADENNSTSGESLIEDFILLEGDHTQNPPSYFEGLKSVGDGVDEISVESVTRNLFSGDISSKGRRISTSNGGAYVHPGYNVTEYIRISPLTDYIISTGERYYCAFYDKDKQYIVGAGYDSKVTSPQNAQYIRFDFKEENIDKVQLIRGSILYEYAIHQSSKKRLLYYNNETQTWEKPVLREWDSIEKHADGKYYYHKRSGKVVLNGSEDWKTGGWTNDSRFELYGSNLGLSCVKDLGICDKLKVNLAVDNISSAYVDCITIGTNKMSVYISSSKLTSNDLTGGKQWLQANPVTVVYKLAQEQVYECTNIDLITYADETNYIVSSGAITPKTTLKVHNNISNVVKILQEKVSLLESNVKASQEVQDMMILESDIRILDIELALMEHMPIKLNLGENIMLRSATYFNFIKGHIVNETYSKDYLENVMNKYLTTNRLTQEEHDELYKLLYPQNYDIELPIEE